MREKWRFSPIGASGGILAGTAVGGVAMMLGESGWWWLAVPAAGFTFAFPGERRTPASRNDGVHGGRGANSDSFSGDGGEGGDSAGSSGDGG